MIFAGLTTSHLEELNHLYMENVNKKVTNADGQNNETKMLKVGNGMYDFKFMSVEIDEEDLEEIEIGTIKKVDIFFS
jgi:hypothetical protein